MASPNFWKEPKLKSHLIDDHITFCRAVEKNVRKF